MVVHLTGHMSVNIVRAQIGIGLAITPALRSAKTNAVFAVASGGKTN